MTNNSSCFLMPFCTKCQSTECNHIRQSEVRIIKPNSKEYKELMKKFRKAKQKGDSVE